MLGCVNDSGERISPNLITPAKSFAGINDHGEKVAAAVLLFSSL